ncbi:MAG: carboxyl-terminal processing protease [Cryomorphaceae bacterium]|jgi:carboxyl-terminal processing protease
MKNIAAKNSFSLIVLIAGLCCASLSTSVYADFVEVKDAELTMNKELAVDIDQTLLNLRYGHYKSSELNDEYSSRTLDAYLKLLDPNKTYFLQSDIDELNIYRYKLDDLLKKRNAEVAFDIFKLYRQRLSERTDLIMDLIEVDFDFTKDESISIDRDQYTWAKSSNELTDKWTKRIKNDTLQQLMAETSIKEVRENLTRRYQRQKDVTYQLKADEVFEWFMNAYTKELGPHTQYMSHATTENFRISMSLSLEGIGAALQTEQDYTVINRILPGGPAERDGTIKPEDKVVGVAQDDEEMINVIGWRLMDVVRMIRGDKGTKVRLQIISGDSAPGSPPETIELVRDVIQLEDQAAKLSSVEIPDGDIDRQYSVISIPSFYSNSGQAKNGAKFTATTHDVRKLLDEMKQTDSEGLIIDLRGNGGGYLNEAITLTGLFIEQGPVVQVIPSNRKAQVLKDRNPAVAYDGPMVVLINRYSASASEIFAAAMQDYGRAVIVGERSFGKGTVQRVAPLRRGADVEHQSQLKFTNAQFFRINGGSTQHKGVTPDIALNSGAEDDEFGERAYDNALPWSQTKPAVYSPVQIPVSMVNQMSEKHLQRSGNSPAFELLRQSSSRIAENKDIKELSLNIDDRQATRDRSDGESLAQLNAYRKSLNLEPVTADTRKDTPLPDEDEHWNIVYHTEAAHILLDQSRWTSTLVTKRTDR